MDIDWYSGSNIETFVCIIGQAQAFTDEVLDSIQIQYRNKYVRPRSTNATKRKLMINLEEGWAPAARLRVLRFSDVNCKGDVFLIWWEQASNNIRWTTQGVMHREWLVSLGAALQTAQCSTIWTVRIPNSSLKCFRTRHDQWSHEKNVESMSPYLLICKSWLRLATSFLHAESLTTHYYCWMYLHGGNLGKFNRWA